MSRRSLTARIGFTLGALLSYRLGTYIPVPNVDPAVIGELYERSFQGISQVYAARRISFEGLSIFALGVFPYLLANAMVLLAAAFSPKLRASVFRGQHGYRGVEPYVRYLTVLIAVVYAYYLAASMENILGASGPFAPEAGILFRLSTVITLTAGTLSLLWLADQVTRHGIGAGIPLILFTDVLTELPYAAAWVLELGRIGVHSLASVIGLLLVATAAVALIVFVERARRRVLVEFPKQRLDGKIVGGSSSHIPLELNAAGVSPVILVGALLPLVSMVAIFSHFDGSAWLIQLAGLFGPGQPFYLMVYACLIVFFTLLCASIRLNPTGTAENLKQRGGFIPGIRPGEKTADYLRYFQVRLGAVAAAYLALICVLPELTAAVLALPFNLSGVGLLVVVWVILDTTKQVHGHLLERGHENASG